MSWNLKWKGDTEIMSKIAEFYGFEVYVDDSFSGEPQIFIDYSEDSISGHYNIKDEKFVDVVFPNYLIDVICDWIGDNIYVLKKMWLEKTVLSVPEWEE